MPVTFHDFARRAAPTRAEPVARSSGKPRASGDVSQWSEARARGRAWLDERTTGRGPKPQSAALDEVLGPACATTEWTCEYPTGEGCMLVLRWVNYAICNYYNRMANPDGSINDVYGGQIQTEEAVELRIEFTKAAALLELVLRRFGEVCALVRRSVAKPYFYATAPYAKTTAEQDGIGGTSNPLIWPYSGKKVGDNTKLDPDNDAHKRGSLVMSLSLPYGAPTGYGLAPIDYDPSLPVVYDPDGKPHSVKDKLAGFFAATDFDPDINPFSNFFDPIGPNTNVPSGCWVSTDARLLRKVVCDRLRCLKERAEGLMTTRAKSVAASLNTTVDALSIKQLMDADFWYSKVAGCHWCGDPTGETPPKPAPPGSSTPIAGTPNYFYCRTCLLYVREEGKWNHRTIIQVLLDETDDLALGAYSWWEKTKPENMTMIDTLCQKTAESVCCWNENGGYSIQDYLDCVDPSGHPPTDYFNCWDSACCDNGDTGVLSLILRQDCVGTALESTLCTDDVCCRKTDLNYYVGLTGLECTAAGGKASPLLTCSEEVCCRVDDGTVDGQLVYRKAKSCIASADGQFGIRPEGDCQARVCCGDGLLPTFRLATECQDEDVLTAGECDRRVYLTARERTRHTTPVRRHYQRDPAALFDGESAAKSTKASFSSPKRAFG